jgi:hypothetical protein
MAELPTRAGPTLLGTATATIATAGAASTWRIVRSILVANVTAAAVTVTVGVGTANADDAAKRILNAVSVPAGDTLEWAGFLPLLGGATPDLLYALCSVASGVTITVGLVDGP